jgi:hypothetical protein
MRNIFYKRELLSMSSILIFQRLLMDLAQEHRKADSWRLSLGQALEMCRHRQRPGRCGQGTLRGMIGRAYS